MINKRILTTLLALAILLSCVGWTPAQAQGTAPIDAEAPADQTSISTLPIEEEEDELPEREPIARLYGEEGDDLNKIVYLNNDGTRTMHLYDYPVKYRDASGEIRDISLEIADGTTELNRFQSSANSIMTAFPSKASDGISLSGEGVSIKLIPNIPAAETNAIHMTGNAKRIDSKTISYDYDAKTTIEYSLTYTGFKEDIVVSEYTGQTEYEFLLQTNGLVLTQIDGSFYLTDESGKIKAAIGDVIVFTADEKNNTMGTMVAETLKENHSYLLTIVLDAQYLADPNTAYPIRIDPTIDINYDANGSGAIEDVTIYSNVTPDGASTSLFVGLRETRGISRILMRFPNLDLSGLTGATVESAEVTLRDLICEGTYLSVYCYPFTGANWTESTASWSMSQTWGPELDSEVISYSNGVNKNPKHRYTFNITAAVQGWINGTYSKVKGLIFKTSNAVETATTYEQRQFASYNRTNYRPTFSMTYALGGTITAANNAVVKGSTLQLTAHVNGTVTWESSDPNIATITSNGLVTGVQAGKVTITATHPNYDIDPFTLWVTLSNGVYYIKNASSGLCLQGTAGQIHINSQKSSQDTRLNQLWKIAYLQNGQYVIRPMQNLSRALTVDSVGYVTVADAAVTDTAVTSAFRWSINYNANGYAIQQNGSTSKTVTPVVSTMPDSSVYSGTWSNNASCHWDLEEIKGVFLRDTSTLCIINSNVQKFIGRGQTCFLSDFGLTLEVLDNIQNISWDCNNEVVMVVTATGKFVGVNKGSTIITAQLDTGGQIYSASFSVCCGGESLLFQTERTPGLDESGNEARDMHVSDLSKAELLAMSPVLGDLATTYDLPPASSSVLPSQGPQALEDYMRQLPGIFATGNSAMRGVVTEMVELFLSGAGGEYSSDVLTETIHTHPNTREFVDSVNAIIREYIESSNENMNAIINNHDFLEDVDDVDEPAYNTTADYTNGLKIALNGIWGYKVEIVDYYINGEGNYFCRIRYTLYDHFGLDGGDVTNSSWYSDFLGHTSQFGSWFVLQRYINCNQNYKPFVTIVTFEETITRIIEL